jgi:hypothetical protein
VGTNGKRAVPDHVQGQKSEGTMRYVVCGRETDLLRDIGFTCVGGFVAITHGADADWYLAEMSDDEIIEDIVDHELDFFFDTQTEQLHEITCKDLVKGISDLRRTTPLYSEIEVEVELVN